VGEFDKLKEEADQYAQQHPQQVKEGEQAVEKQLGIHTQDDGQQGQAHQDPASGGEQGQAPAGQGQ
jgi:hypothetical protein